MRISTFSILTLATLSANWALAQHRVSITVAGSTTVRPIIEAAATVFKKRNPGVDFIIGAGGSSQGIGLAGQRAVDIGMASRILDPAEKSGFGGLAECKIGLDALVMVVNASNTVTDLTTEEIRSMYVGEIHNWSAVGGANLPIVQCALNSNHGTSEVFLGYFGLESRETGMGAGMIANFRKKGDVAFPTASARVIEDHHGVLAQILTTPNSLGYVSLGQALQILAKGARIRLLSVDHRSPSIANVRSGDYPFSKPLLLLVKEGAGPAVLSFLDFLLGPEGQEIVEQLNFIPVNPGSVKPSRGANP